MATNEGIQRRGLPRHAQGEPWPNVGSLPGEVIVDATAAIAAAPTTIAKSATVKSAAENADLQVTPRSRNVVRAGLPRTAGAAQWPLHGTLAGALLASTESANHSNASADTHSAVLEAESILRASQQPKSADAEDTESTATESSLVRSRAATATTPTGKRIRSGLPRVAGGAPWPPVGLTEHGPTESPQPAAVQAAATEPAHSDVTQQIAAQPVAPKVEPAAVVETVRAQPDPALAEKTAAAVRPAPSKAVAEPATESASKARHLVRRVTLITLGSIFAAGILVLAARGITTLPGVPAFLQRYPGEYHLPETAEPGFPAWARWTHFLNFFLMVLIIRSGLLVRHQAKPPAFWTPRRGGKKISINLWLHTSLDVLWMANGLVFVVLLFASGHWVRIVPTSWEVFPNALSAALQYATLNWPVENGWVNYNSLQQIMYFLVVFVAAPLAAVTGVRMSEWWPEKAERLNKLYPAPVARALHFPTMLFFVFFIVTHVILVMATGALRNLNHMFAGTDVVNWTGFWLFALAIAVTAGGWIAAKPLVLAPIAGLFGKVSNR